MRGVVNPVACVVEVLGGIILWTGRRLGTAAEADLKSLTGGKKIRFFFSQNSTNIQKHPQATSRVHFPPKIPFMQKFVATTNIFFC